MAAPTRLSSRRQLLFKGIVSATPLDQSSGPVGTSTSKGTTTPATAATTAATTQATELIIGGVSNATPGAANNSCTARTLAGIAGTMQVEPVYKNVTTTGVQTCGSAVANSTWAAAVATYKVDMTSPTAAVTFPSTSPQNAASWTGTITGSATDEAGGSGIDVTAGKTQLSIHDDTANTYWTGAAWGAVAGAETYFNPTTGPTTVTPGTAATWTYTFAAANLTAGHSYTIHTTTNDYAGNTSGVGSQSFSYVNTPTPTVVGSGTGATAVNTLVLTTTAAVPLNSTLFIVAAQNGSSGTAMTATDNGTTPNTIRLGHPEQQHQRKHVDILRATVTQALASGKTITITYTLATAIVKAATAFYVPGIVTASPLDQTGAATGSSTAAAATTGAATTQANEFIIGGVAVGTVGAGSNGCTASTAAGTAGTMQEVPVYKTVVATGTQTCGDTVTFGQWAAATATYKIDGTAPTAAVPMAPAYNAAGWSGVFGTATDEAGGSGIDVTAGVTQLSLHDDTSNQYWTGAAWGAVAGAETYVNPTTGPSAATAGTAATWSYTTVTSANLTAGHNYTVHTKTADYAKNASSVATDTFNYDTTAPTASFTVVPGTNPLYQFYNSGSHTLYYNPTVAGDFKIDGSASSDAGSGLAGTIFPGIGTTANTAMTQSPVLFWRFSEAGTSVADSSGYGNTGVTSGGVARNTTPTAFTNDTDPGITLTAASFGKVVGAYPRAIPSGSASRSEVVWFKTTTTTEQALATYGCTDGVTGCAAGQNFGFMVIPSANNLMFWGWGDDLTFTTSAVVANTADGNWHQAVITYNGGTNSVTAYLDGTSLGSQTPTTALNTMAAGAQGFNVGVGVPINDAANGGKYFNGSIDDVSVYSSVLSGAQVTAQYAARTLPVGFTGIGSVASGSPWQSLTNAWTTSATTARGPRRCSPPTRQGTRAPSALNYVVDSSLPTGSLTAPAASANVRGSAVAVSSNSADGGSGVASAQFQYSPAGAGTWTNIGVADTTNPYSVNWDTTAVADGLYDLRVITTDNVGNTFTSALVTNVRVDNTLPTNALTLSSVTGGAYLSGTTVYYRGAALGNFQLTNTVTDAGSGPASSIFPALGGTVGGWTHTPRPSTPPPAAPTSPPTTSPGPPAATAPTEAVTSTDNAGNTSTATTLTYTNDSTAPTGSITAPAASANVRGGGGRRSPPTPPTAAPASPPPSSSAPPPAPAPGQPSATDTTSPYSVSWDTTAVTDGLYDLRVITTDNVGNTFTSATVTNVRVDNTLPTNALTLSSVTGGAYLSGTTVYYRGTALGNFQLTNTVADAGCGPASCIFPALGGTVGGWTHTTQTVNTPAGGPYVTTNNFAWPAAETNSPTEAVTSTDNAGNTTPPPPSPSPTTPPHPPAAPSPSTASAATGGGTSSYSNSGNFTIGTRTDYNADTGSGFASSTLTVATATLTANTCGSYGAPPPSSAPPPKRPTTGCYLYTLTGLDNVGNSATITTTVMVDTTAPSRADGFSFASTTSGAYYSGAGSTVYFRRAAAAGGFTSPPAPPTPTAASLSYTLPPARWAHLEHLRLVERDPHLHLHGGASTPGSQPVTATNNAGGITGAGNLTTQSDSTAPTGGALTANGKAATGGGTSQLLHQRQPHHQQPHRLQRRHRLRLRQLHPDHRHRPPSPATAAAATAHPPPSSAPPPRPSPAATATCSPSPASTTSATAATITTTVMVDTTAPTAPTGVQLQRADRTAYWPGAGTIVYFQGGSAGGFTATASGATDADTGIASYTYGAIGGAGWSNVAGAYSFTGISPTGTGSVTATNNAGLTGAGRSFTAQSDSTAPAGGAFTANGTAATGGGSVELPQQRHDADDQQPHRLQRDPDRDRVRPRLLDADDASRHALTGNSCGSYGAPTTITGTTSQTVASGNCYLLTLTGTDNVGNTATITHHRQGRHHRAVARRPASASAASPTATTPAPARSSTSRAAAAGGFTATA